jgi:uncharacterized protein YutE (UPF0331/DUF86 family)
VAVVLRPEVVRERLLRLEEVVSRLEELAQPGAMVPGSGFRDAWAAERGLQLAAEIVLDIGNHILSAHFGVSAQDYEDIIAQLGVHAVIDDRLRERLKGLGGFRNILVHGYLRIDPKQVAEHLRTGPPKFADFSRAVRGWLSRHGRG